MQVTEGKAVIELAVVQTDKGHALDVLRHQVGATAAVFLGDDVTDEKAFARLSGPDLGVKVGAGETLAGFRIDDPAEVGMVLAFLLEERRNWLYGDQAPPIERLTMLASERSVALLTPDARLTWLCHPEPDSAAVFADLLGGPSAGHFSITPERGGAAAGPALPAGHDDRRRPAGRACWSPTTWTTTPTRTAPTWCGSSPAPRTAVVEFAPRPEFAQVPGAADPVRRRPAGARHLRPGRAARARRRLGDHLRRHARHRPRGRHGRTPDAPVVLELRCGTNDLDPHEVPEPERAAPRGRVLDRLARRPDAAAGGEGPGGRAPR